MRRGQTDEQALLALLRVDEGAPWEEVRRAFREAVRASHPDLNPGDVAAERRLKELTAAWESVNTPAKWQANAGPPASGVATHRSTGRFRIQRQQRGSAGLLDWNLELDGVVVATIENGATSLVEAEPGGHSLRVFYGSRSSLPLRLELHRGQELVLGCRQLENLRTNIFAPKRSLVIERLGSRPWV